MNIEIFSLCDAANQAQGKLNFLGSFDTIYAKEVPLTHPICAVALRIRFYRIETGRHHIQLTIVDPDGTPVIKELKATIDVLNPQQKHTSVSINIVMNILGLAIPAFGDYQIDLAVDKRQEASLPLWVVKLEPPSPPRPS